MATHQSHAKPSFSRLVVVQFLVVAIFWLPLAPLARAVAAEKISPEDIPAADAGKENFNRHPPPDTSAALENSAQTPVNGGCPAGGAPQTPDTTRLIYLGQTSFYCDASLPVSARLTDACGNALAGRRLTFAFAAQNAVATTDAEGIARTNVARPPGMEQAPVTVSYAGEAGRTPAQDSATLRIRRVNTVIRYTGRTLLASGAPESVSAVLISAEDRRPVPGVTLDFEVSSIRVSSRTDANGVAKAVVTLPAAGTFEREPLKITFGGDNCYNPSSATAEVTGYFPTSFVIWGGNSGGLSLGQRVNFWGHSWAKQVTAGDYRAHNDFKGYADTVNQSRLCQLNATTGGTPRLNASCWSTKPGQSFPPQTLPTHIGVIVTNSMDKAGARDFGNIAALVVVKVSPEPRYGADPGKPGFGDIVAVIEDGANIFARPPALAATQTQPASVLPGQGFAVALSLSNTGAAAATGVSVSETFAGGVPPSATAERSAVAASGTQALSFQTTIPPLAARGTDESSADYQKRLGAADGALYTSVGLINFGDAAGRTYPVVHASSSSRLQLPRLAAGVSAPSCVWPGMTIPYVIKITNIGSAAATGGTARVLFADGTSTEVAVNNLGPGRSVSSTVNWRVPVISGKGATESNADYLARLASFDRKTLAVNVSVTWTDGAGNNYGAVEQQCSSIERVPILSQTSQAPAPLLPGQKSPLGAAVQNAGSGNAFQAKVRVTNPDATVSDAAPFNLAAGNSAAAQATLTAPAVPAKQAGESDASYLSRLQAADNQPVDFTVALEWSDASGNTYGPVADTLQTNRVLPIVVITLSAKETAEAGDAIVYLVKSENVGHATADGVDVSVTLPGGTAQKVQLGNDTLPPGEDISAAVEFTIPATQPEGQINALSRVFWQDSINNAYGSLSAAAATNVINPNQPPVVDAGPDQTVNFSETATLNGSASDDGRPLGSTLTVTWSQVSGPGAVTFGSPNRAVTTASFGAEGSYVLRLAASDSVLSASDEMIVNVVPPPTTPTYSDTADLTQGETVNLGTDEYNHLHITNTAEPFNFIWVAVSSKGTIVKIDTETGKVLGEYYSSPAGQPRDPSRTTVDHNGNVWASNRAGNSVVRIGLVENGQCIDRNGNGVIDTSRGFADLRPWPNTGGADTAGGVKTAADECIINYTRVTSRGTRHVSVNAANDVWVSGREGKQFDLIDGQTGLIKRKEPSVGFGGYGGLIDKRGVIWSARNLLRWDTALPLKGANGGNWKGWGHDSYGLCIDGEGNVWNTSYVGNTIRKFAPDGTLLGEFRHGAHWAQGCVVDKKGDVWVAHSMNGHTVGHLKNDGTWVGNVLVGNGPTGVAVDARGKIWTTNHNSRNVTRIDPDAGGIGADEVTRIGLIDFTGINLGGTLYNYSDMTGSTLSGVPAGGTWSQVFDSRMTGAEWGVVGWNGRVCGDGALVVTAASSSNGTQFSAPVTAANGAGLSLPPGRYLKVTVSFRRATSGESPFLYDLTVGTRGFNIPPASDAPPTVDAGQDQRVTMPNAASLVGAVCDAGRVAGGGLSINWEKLSGPGTVTFGNANAPGTSAAFSEAGEYVLRLTANDSQLSTSDEVTVLVMPFNDAPTVNAGADQSVILPASLSLNGAVSDDGLPSGSSVAVSWSKISGPGEVTFTDAVSANTSVVFGESGTYVLRLVADDSGLANVDDVTVKVFPPNQRPTASAGEDQTIRLPAKASLSGTVGDDGVPLGKTLAVSWSKVSGPGTVSFSPAGAAQTAAGFSLPGTYLLRLTANDSQLSATDELSVTVLPANQPPTVSAGADQTITLPDAAQLTGTAADDGLPEASTVTTAWSKLSGPGLVQFGNPGSPNTAVSFSEAGTYVLRLTASDSALNRSDDVKIIVNPNPVNFPPVVKAGDDQVITLPARATLSGVVGDDRKPAGSVLKLTWSKVSGAGTVTFANAAAAATTASFTAAGTYVLQLTASDTELTASDELTITVLPVNQPPVVKAGADQTVSVPGPANLSGTASDDGQPAGGGLTLAWSKVSGPGTVTFSNANAASTSATFSASGVYVLRLTAGDSQHSRTDDVTVSVNRAPTVAAGADQTIHLPNAVSLRGVVTDDALPPGKIIKTTWSKVSGPGTVTFNRPEATATTATFTEAGSYVLRLHATDSIFEAGDELSVTVNPPLPPPPAVAITSPADGAEITTRVDVTGSVSGGNWKLEYSLGPDVVSPGNSVWTTISSGSTPVTNAVLGTFDPTLLLNGGYAIRLSSTDASGQTASVIRSAVVAGQQKVGNFTVSYEDLSVPVAGLPIQLIRTYDSRDKRMGDFGVGWTLGIRNVRLEKSVELGRYWRGLIVTGTIPQYCLQPSRPNIVTITFPDDRVYKFQATTVKQCQPLSPLEFARFGFTPMPGTRGTLVPEAPLDIMVSAGYPGPLELLNSADPQLRTYDPTVFRFTDENGTVFIIDQKLGVRSITDPSGNRLTINRDGIIHSSGKSAKFLRDPQGRITQITDPLGNAMTYAYDANGDLSIFKDRESNETKFTYNGAHGLLSILDARGIQPIRNDYDDRGRLISHTDAFGRKTTYAHDLNARQELVTDRLGNATLHEYDARGNVLRVTHPNGGVESATYDRRDNKLTETNALGKTITYTYDANDKLIKEVDPLGLAITYTYDARGNVLTLRDAKGGLSTNAYDAKGRIISKKDPLGNTTTYTYNTKGLLTAKTDPSGNVFRYEYDASGNLTKETDAIGHAVSYTNDAGGKAVSREETRTTSSGVVERLTSSYQYDRMDRLVKTTGPLGTSNQALYNEIGKQVATIDQQGRRTTFDYDEMGRLVRITYPDGTKEEYAYDAEGRRVRSTDRDNRTTTVSYDSMGQPVRTTHPTGAASVTTYDVLGRVSSTTDARGNTTRFEYDPACGCPERLTRVVDALNNATTFTYDANNNRATTTDANNHTTTLEYDSRNRVVKVIHPDASSETVSYDAAGRILGRTDQAGRATKFEYDGVGRLAKVTDAHGGVTRYLYDEVGNLISRTDSLDRTVKYEYDKLGRRIRRTLPLGMSETYAYDAIGNLISKTDFRGKVTGYAYDSMNRLVSRIPDASLNEQPVSFTYDAAGRRASMVDASGTTTYTYDAAGRLARKATPQGALTYTYDAAGKLQTMRSSNANGVSLDYTYDALNRLSTVTDNRQGTGVTAYTYDAVGQLSEVAHPNGVRDVYSYNNLNRLTNVAISKVNPIAGYAYTFDPAGNRLSATELGGRKARYTYDELSRLTNETVSDDPQPQVNGTIDYGLDAVGNRVRRTSTVAAIPSADYTYDANDRLSGDSYDPNGNTVAANGKSYAYDFENRIKEVNGGQIKIVYDGDGNRASVTADGVTTKYLVDTHPHAQYARVVEELVGGEVRRVYTYGTGLLHQSQRIGGAWVTSFYGADGHGSVRLLTDAGGAVTNTYDYDAFGNLVRSAGDTPNDFLFAGEQYDSNLGMLYLRARYMNPRTGRFMTMDRVEGDNFDPPSLHKYLYAGANPVNNIDPSGNQWGGITEKLNVLGNWNILNWLAGLALLGATVDVLVKHRPRYLDPLRGRRGPAPAPPPAPDPEPEPEPRPWEGPIDIFIKVREHYRVLHAFSDNILWPRDPVIKGFNEDPANPDRRVDLYPDADGLVGGTYPVQGPYTYELVALAPESGLYHWVYKVAFGISYLRAIPVPGPYTRWMVYSEDKIKPQEFIHRWRHVGWLYGGHKPPTVN